jgi:hypothetical protein
LGGLKKARMRPRREMKVKRFLRKAKKLDKMKKSLK